MIGVSLLYGCVVFVAGVVLCVVMRVLAFSLPSTGERACAVPERVWGMCASFVTPSPFASCSCVTHATLDCR